MTYQHTLKVADTLEVLTEIRTRTMWFDGRGQITMKADGLILNFDGDKDGLVRFLKTNYPNAVITDFPL